MSVPLLRDQIAELLETSLGFQVQSSGPPEWFNDWMAHVPTVFAEAAVAVPGSADLARRLSILLWPQVHYSSGPSSLYSYLNSARGLLVELDLILAATGARQAGTYLALDSLHPWVWNDRTRQFWSLGQFRPAIHEAASRVDYETQQKLGRLDLSGKDLVNQAWSTDDPRIGKKRLRLPGIHRPSQHWTSAHEGAMHFGAGLFQAIRNRTGHDTESGGAPNLEEGSAMQSLCAFSLYATWVDAAVAKDARGRAKKK